MPKYVGDDEYDFSIYWETLSRQPEEPEDLPADSRKNDTNKPSVLWKAIEYLEEVASHIDWRIQADGDDNSGIQWDCVVVPNDQLNEAEEIMNRYLDGDDLSNYSPMDQFPEIYMSTDRGRIIHPDIQKFYSLCENLGDMILEGDENLLNKLESLLDILPQIYLLGNKLPYISRWFSGDKEYHSERDFYEYEDFLELGENNRFVYINPPFVGGKIEEGYLSEMVASIYFDSFAPAVDDFHSDNLIDVAHAVNNWHLKFKFSTAADIITVLPIINAILNEIKKNPKSFSRSKPKEDSLFGDD